MLDNLRLSAGSFLCDYIASRSRRRSFVTHNVLQGLAVLIPPPDSAAEQGRRNDDVRRKRKFSLGSDLRALRDGLGSPRGRCSVGDDVWEMPKWVRYSFARRCAVVDDGDRLHGWVRRLLPGDSSRRIIGCCLFVTGIALLSAVTATISEGTRLRR